MNDQLLQLDKAFIHNLHEQHLYESHVESEINSALEPLMTTPGDAIGFGILQDLLSELSTSLGSPTFVEDIQTYISMLVHCVKSATRVFQGPLQSNFD
ncbi:unnamed protein product [Timema podura]|uniref:Uncharacterized protein n=1 Tax=Timema podura TaxID=61482 RepID=A0ABN7P3X1_TIMPD|nr:unnamed protein product [Timema podura]